MATNAFLGGITFARKNTTGSPVTYDAIEEVFDLPGVGATNSLVQATHFGSGTTHEYISGLADGEEFTISANRVHGSPNVQDVLIADVENQSTITLKVTHDRTNVSPKVTKEYEFSAVALGWTLNPSIEDKNTISFTFKISGSITRT